MHCNCNPAFPSILRTNFGFTSMTRTSTPLGHPVATRCPAPGGWSNWTDRPTVLSRLRICLPCRAQGNTGHCGVVLWNLGQAPQLRSSKNVQFSVGDHGILCQKQFRDLSPLSGFRDFLGLYDYSLVSLFLCLLWGPSPNFHGPFCRKLICKWCVSQSSM